MHDAVSSLLQQIRACELCAAHLPFGPRPVLQASGEARILIVGQAPGRRVHASGVPFDDPSGERLRDWMGIDRTRFYDAQRIAIVPMGFCYPGSGRHGDLPPRPECAPAWHPRLLPLLDRVRLTLILGRYAQVALIDDARRANLTATVANWRTHLEQGRLPLPHPSPRNRLWQARNPWFTREVLPALRAHVALALA